MSIHLSKRTLSISEQIELLRSRGMVIEDEVEANHWLTNIGYYRLSGYWFVYRKDWTREAADYDVFVPGTTFASVVRLYTFDQRLRSALLQGIESVEVGLKAQLG